LDALDEASDETALTCILAVAGLRLCAAFGWGLDFDQCVGCGAARPVGKSAYVDPVRGGVVCSSCGAGGTLLDAALLSTLARVQRDPSATLAPRDGDVALGLVERSLMAHGNLRSAP
jgi:DNA repair protein RecO (recombination protein O)